MESRKKKGIKRERKKARKCEGCGRRTSKGRVMVRPIYVAGEFHFNIFPFYCDRCAPGEEEKERQEEERRKYR